MVGENRVPRTFSLNADLDDRFRKEVVARKGFGKGVFSEALEEAMQMWLQQQEDE